MTWYCTLEADSYDTQRETFEWDLPADYNLAHDFLRKHDDIDRVALYQAYPDGRRERYTFADLDRRSNRLANGLCELGIERGDRVAVVLSQRPENLLTHLACWKLGAVSLPLSVLFGPEALRYRLDDSDTKAVVCNPDRVAAVREVAPDCEALDYVFIAGDDENNDHEGDAAEGGTDAEARSDEGEGTNDEGSRAGIVAVREFDDALAAEDTFEIVATDADTPAIIVYTSGSKGVLHTHDIWVGHCPAFSMYFEHDLDGVYWTPADWAWIGALGDLVFPALHYGQPIVGYPMGEFDSGTPFSLMAEFGVTGAFLPPTAIRMLMNVENPTDRYDLSLEVICSGGEPLTPEILTWADDALGGIPVNELYGQTEANLLVTNCREWFPAQAGSMGKPVPGHEVAVLDGETGEEMPAGEVGEIAVERRDDPVVFEQYLNEPEKTAAATVGRWHLTGDLGYRDEEGYFWFTAREGDLIIMSGYRVGPGEVESVLLEHEAVSQAGVIGVPDEQRGEIIKAVIELASGIEGDGVLREELRALMREDLAKHEYPREIEFSEELPRRRPGRSSGASSANARTPSPDRSSGGTVLPDRSVDSAIARFDGSRYPRRRD
jgi:acetyl-CoA synthetase